MVWLVKRIAYGVGGLAVLILLLLAGVYGVSSRRFERTFPAGRPESPPVPTDAAAIERGRHLAQVIAKCGDCHDQDLGGRVFIDAGPMIGRLYAPNITKGKGSVTESFSVADWERVIRHGVTPEGRALKIMPSEDFIHMSDPDLGALLAYLRTVPPVDRGSQPTLVGPLSRALYLAGKFPLLPAEQLNPSARHAEVPVGVTKEYGEYLANVGGCTGCHGPGLSGGRIPGTPPAIPPAQNLTPAGIGTWTEADFFRALRTGVRPDGSHINAFMPWMSARNMTDDETRAIWFYLRSVPPRAAGTM
jgi:mono/diheme cytochrome c family protein